METSYDTVLLEGHHHRHKDEGEAEHKHEDEHEHEERGGYGPHVWLFSLNIKREAENIKNTMTEANPASAEYYRTNYAAWSARCDQSD